MEIRIATIEEIRNLKNRWNNLVKSMALPTIFLTWEWITTWIKNFGNKYEVIVLLIFDEDELVAILPLAKINMKLRRHSLVQNRVLTICGTLELYPDHLDLICAQSSNAPAYIEIIIDFLTYNYTRWDILFFNSLTADGLLLSYLRSSNTTYKTTQDNGIIAPYIQLEQGSSAYFQSMKRKKRYNLNREKRILLKDKNVHFQKTISRRELKKALDDLFDLHQNRAREKSIQSTFAGREIYNFHVDISQVFYDLGWLRLYFLKSNNTPIATAYGFLFENRFYFYQTGMDPEWKQFSPGKVMIFSILEHVSDSNIIEFDFLEGAESYKSFWTKDFRRLGSYIIFNTSMTSNFEYYSMKAQNFIKSRLIKSGIITFF